MPLPKYDRKSLVDAVKDLTRRPRLTKLLSVIEEQDDGRVPILFEEWLEATDLLKIDGQSLKLVPLLVDRLSRAGAEHRRLPYLRGMVKFLWVRTEHMRRAAIRAAEFLRGHQIGTVAIKGLALQTSYGARSTLRPMLDADLVVDPPWFADAVRLLLATGWTKVGQDKKSVTLRELTREGTAGPVEIDLHEHALPMDQSFLAMRMSVPSGEPFHVLDAAGMLIVTTMHGTRHDGGGLWKRDLELVFSSGHEVAWQRLVFYAHTRRLSLALQHGLAAARVLGPRELSWLSGTNVSVVEALEFHHHATGDRIGGEAARLMERLRIPNMPITDQDIERTCSRVRFDQRWLKEWQA